LMAMNNNDFNAFMKAREKVLISAIIKRLKG
jgi:hypothetical protein